MRGIIFALAFTIFLAFVFSTLVSAETGLETLARTLRTKSDITYDDIIVDTPEEQKDLAIANFFNTQSLIGRFESGLTLYPNLEAQMRFGDTARLATQGALIHSMNKGRFNDR